MFNAFLAITERFMLSRFHKRKLPAIVWAGGSFRKEANKRNISSYISFLLYAIGYCSSQQEARISNSGSCWAESNDVSPSVTHSAIA